MIDRTNINSNSIIRKEIKKINFTITKFEIENKKFKEIKEKSLQKEKNICYFCKKPFSTLGNLKNHILDIHEKFHPFKCTFPGCNKKYFIERRYQVHLRTHTGEKPYICQICNKSFNEKGNLKTHLRFHSELRPFKCPHCTKTYKNKGHLKEHIEIKHNLIKKYICNFCNKKFGRISNLKSHIRIHTGEKKYKCKLEGCNKYFVEKGNMEIHYKRHLKKLNKVNQLEKISEKKYGKKAVENDYEEKIKEAINKLKYINNNYQIKNKTNDKKNL